MAYTPPACNLINFNFAGAYTPPACNLINFDIGGGGPHEILSADSNIFIEADVSEIFHGDLIASANAEIALEFEESILEIVWIIASDSTEIPLDFEEGLMRGTEAHHLPTNLSPDGRGYSWDLSIITDEHGCFSFEEGQDIYNHLCASFSEFSLPNLSSCCFWGIYPIKDNHVCSLYSDFFVTDNVTCGGWLLQMTYLDESIAHPWGNFRVHADYETDVVWNAPDPNDVKKCKGWDLFELENRQVYTVWNAPSPWDVGKCNAWGPFSYYLLCTDDLYAPPKACEPVYFNFPNKYNLIGNVCSGITFQLNNYTSEPMDPRCSWDHIHSGIRDRYLVVEFPDTTFPAPKKVYYMLNSVLVKKLLTNQPIEVLHIDATIDRNSWLWQFNVTVASRDCLEVIMPVNGVFSNIEICINGYTWICTVEGWRENRKFGADSWTITGRSPSLMFAAPVASKKSDTEEISLQGQTIFEQLVTGVTVPPNWPPQLSSWTADFSAYSNTCTGFAPHSSWYVPGGTLSYSNKTDIEVLQSISGAIGAYIQTEANCTGANCKLYVKPIYPHMPWDWDDSNANIEWKPVIEDQCTEIARTSVLQPYYQAVHVMGESVGGSNDGTGPDGTNTAIFVDVCRDGWCGGGTATYAPMITNPMVTSSKAGLEKGRMALGKTGEWLEHTLRFGVLCPGSGFSGLFLPGDMITVLERGYPWYGQVKSTTISAMMTNKTFTVSQQINVEEFIKPI